jgi:hypothetical protein
MSVPRANRRNQGHFSDKDARLSCGAQKPQSRSISAIAAAGACGLKPLIM